MKKMTLLKLLAVIGVCLVAVGFLRGWFTLSTVERSAESHKVDVRLTVDPDKAKEDAQTLKDKAHELTGKPTRETATPPSENGTAGGTAPRND